MLECIVNFLKVRENEPDLNRARFMAMTRLIPLMYLILSINMIAVSWAHWTVAPLTLTVAIPTALILFNGKRAIDYFRAREKILSDAHILKQLRGTVWVAGPAGMIFTCWALAFYQYGSSHQHVQIVFFIGVTVMACGLCMMHLRQAPIILILAVIPETSVFLILQGDGVLTAIALNLALVSSVILVILYNHHDDFARMIYQQTAQSDHRKRLEDLNKENMRLANTDSLTGLPNRRAFLSNIDDMVNTSLHGGPGFVVALLDLDGFKAINDLYGHPAGDELLIETGHRLTIALGTDVFIARLLDVRGPPCLTALTTLFILRKSTPRVNRLSSPSTMRRTSVEPAPSNKNCVRST